MIISPQSGASFLNNFYIDYFNNVGNLYAARKFRDDPEINEDIIVRTFQKTFLPFKENNTLPTGLLILRACQSKDSSLNHFPKDILNLIIANVAQLNFSEMWENLVNPENYTQFSKILEIKRLENELKTDSDEQTQSEKQNKIEEIRKEINLQYDWL